jgi:glycosyltransferase involved in cell wall biosynthesis
MISIVMAYYNRLPQLTFTLKTFQSSKYKDIEIVIVDDYSSSQHLLDRLQSEFPLLNLKIIKMQDQNSVKTYVGPSIPYNVGFRQSSGNIIIIQNPECCHVGDVISYVDQHCNDESYLSFHCWASGKRDLGVLHAQGYLDTTTSSGRWYNHQKHRPASYHFTTAITRKNLIDLNGFDEQYSAGFAYDDDEFIERIKKKKLKIKFVSEPWTIHQYHGKSFNHLMNPAIIQDNAIFHKENMKNLSVRAKNKQNIV